MFIDMILKTIPRSLRAVVALIVMVVSIQQAFTALQTLLLPGSGSVGDVIRFTACLVFGVVAAGFFYYYQSLDSVSNGSHQSLETLNAYHEAKNREQRIAENRATPVFSSHDGEIKH